MAAVAQSGAREALSAYPTSPIAAACDSPSLACGDSPSTTRSPRCEAFVMTGDKILNLNHHISPNYAKVARDQLPPSTQIADTPKPRPPPTLADFPSVRRSMRSRIPTSRSTPEAVSTQRQVSCPDTVVESCSPPQLSSGSPSIVLPTPTVEEKPSTAVSSATTSPEKSPEKISKPRDFTPIDDDSPSTATTAQVMESSMHSSYYKSAFSNPQISHKKTSSTDTFVISTGDSPSKHSTVTVNAMNCVPSVSTTTSPSHRRLMNTRRQHANGNEVFGSFRSDGTIGADSQCPVEEEREASREAAKLFRLEGCTKADVAERLNDRSEFSAMVATKYLELFMFSSLRIDAALREFLSRVELRGDSSERERLLRFFSMRYHQCDPSLFDSVDDVHTLTCALLLLNSDLHGQNLGKKMTIRDFINNISHTGVHFKRDLLKALYNSIKEHEIVHASKYDNPPASRMSSKRSFVSRQLLLEVDPESQVEYKCGYIMRKCLYDSDGAKTPFGRRGWKEWYARLRGLVLYLGRDDSDKKRSRYETFNNAILLHHAFAEPAPDYKKKQHIFRLRTANLGEYLFQTTSASEVEDWVMQINFACARFSSRALPPPACSGGAFSRTRLPKLPSSAPLAQQLKAHESAACELREQLSLVRQEAPPLKAKGRPVEEFFFKERYLTQEILRYDTYCRLLRSRLPGGGCELGGAPSDSTSGVHSKSDIADDLDKMSYREALNHH
ncbi:unnamed protein product [Cylicocyclus nassatus]|uniref:Uncharacterized protein n=1 Tax=Cylicocyclus nassatus TaxID=53992 RepID=A0AA36GYS7_CYLNA|nr:unnamed protein product [Cylicocyclus nassatus]